MHISGNLNQLRTGISLCFVVFGARFQPLDFLKYNNWCCHCTQLDPTWTRATLHNKTHHMLNSKKRLCLRWWCESLWNRDGLNFYVWDWEKLSFLYYQFVTLNIFGVVHATSSAKCSCANGHIPCLLSGCISQNKCCLLFLGCFAHACALLDSLLTGIPFLLSFCLLQMVRSGSQQKQLDFHSKWGQQQAGHSSQALQPLTGAPQWNCENWIDLKEHLGLDCFPPGNLYRSDW